MAEHFPTSTAESSDKPVSTRLYPAGMLNVLSRQEVERLHTANKGELAGLLRRCVLAVLNSDHLGDDVEQLLSSNAGFEIDVEQVNRGLRLQISNAPAGAFVDGEIIEGIRALLSAVIRDLVYYDSEIRDVTVHSPTSLTLCLQGRPHRVFSESGFPDSRR